MHELEGRRLQAGDRSHQILVISTSPDALWEAHTKLPLNDILLQQIKNDLDETFSIGEKKVVLIVVLMGSFRVRV